MWLHLLAAMVWIGGLAFISMVLAPTLRDPALRSQAVPLLRSAGRKFMRIGYASLAVLTVNGVTMTCNNGNWSSLPPKSNGGYCVQTTAGNHPWAYFATW